MSARQSLDAAPELPSSFGLFLIFSRIGLTSFGGGLSGWLLREFVQDRAWLTEEEFLNGLALSQALPGVNVTNMSIWIGYRLLGTPGAVASVAGIILPAAVFIILLAVTYRHCRASRSRISRWTAPLPRRSACRSPWGSPPRGVCRGA